MQTGRPVFVLSTSAAAAALLVLFVRRRRKQLAEGAATEELRAELENAEARVAELQRQLAKLQAPSPTLSLGRANGELRIWMDGAFDMFHYGHANAFRQGRARGTYLVVGVNDDESITKCKGPPVLNDDERIAMVRACKFVDEVVPHVPYVMNDEYLRFVIQKYRIDYVVHGDDPCIVDGKNVYETAVALGKYRTIPRTEGISTTEIVGRMLVCTTSHHQANSAGNSPLVTPSSGPAGMRLSDIPELRLGVPLAAVPEPPFVRESQFMTTSRMLGLFAGRTQAPEGARVVYVDGGWDMFHASHVRFLEEASKLGDFLLVGVHADSVVHAHRGANYPILNINERVLSVLACKWVGDVVIGPPWHLTKEMLAALNVSVVAHGSVSDSNDDDGRDPYAVPKQMGIYREIPSCGSLTVEIVVQRINDNHERFSSKVARKKVAEQDYYDARYGFPRAPK